jgi:hypothetical protein
MKIIAVTVSPGGKKKAACVQRYVGIPKILIE